MKLFCRELGLFLCVAAVGISFGLLSGLILPRLGAALGNLYSPVLSIVIGWVAVWPTCLYACPATMIVATLILSNAEQRRIWYALFRKEPGVDGSQLPPLPYMRAEFIIMSAILCVGAAVIETMVFLHY